MDKPTISEVMIEGERMFSDVLGVATLAGRRTFLIVSIIGRRSAMDFALPSLHKGVNLTFEKNTFYSIGAKRYMGKKGSLPHGIAKTLVIPNPHIQVSHDDGDDDVALKNAKTVFWHGASDVDDMIWNSIRRSPVPLLDTWKKPMIQILKDTDAIDELCAQQGIPHVGHERITPIDFVIGDPLWGGLSIQVSDDDIAVAAQFLLRNGRIAA